MIASLLEQASAFVTERVKDAGGDISRLQLPVQTVALIDAA